MSKWALETKIRAGFVLATALLVMAGGFTLWSYLRGHTSAHLVIHTLDVRESLNDVLRGLSEAEAGQRGYVISGDEVFLEGYRTGLARFQSSLQHLQFLTRDNPAQQHRLALLKPVAERRAALLQQIIEARTQKGFRAAQDLIDSGRGRKAMNEVRKIVTDMEKEELELLSRRIQQSGTYTRTAENLGSLFVILTLILLLASFRVICRDLTARKRDQEALDRLFRLSPDMLCIARFDGYFKRLNPAWEKVLGYSLQELMSRPWLDFVHPEDRDVTIEAGKRLMKGEEIANFENRYRTKDGSYRVLSWSVAPSAEYETLYATARDITARKNAEQEVRELNELLKNNVQDRTQKLEVRERELLQVLAERKKIEEQLYQAQKMEAVGRLAGGIAHDFNNLLTVILGFSHLLMDNVQLPAEAQAHASEISKAGQRAAALTRQLLTFSRRQVMQLQVLDLNKVVGEATKMLERLIGEDIQLKTVLTPTLWKIKADPVQIQQILLNLAVNSRDAMPQGGKLTIETANVQLDEAYARNHAKVRPGPYVMLAVSDTGAGMDAETQSHIFEPFFTTKEKGKGTGLGLATVYGIVKQSDGNIYVYSEPGVGTTFKIYLPRAEGEEGRPHLNPPVPATVGMKTILLAEDEDGVRTLARKVLEARGYQVLEAREGKEALDLAEKYQGPIHLLLTDVVMPGMRGRQLSDRVMELRPDIKVIYMSGYTDESAVDLGMLESGTEFVAKPFTPDDLISRVQSILS